MPPPLPQISARLALPYMQPSQAQKHVTHNEALERLDAVTQLVVAQFGAVTPPAVPNAGEIHALGGAPTGDWAGEGGKLACYTESGWLFIAPQKGWRAWGIAEGEMRAHTGGDWAPIAGPLQNAAGIGIGTVSDSVNRLSVAAEATLLSHAGAGHQLKINKHASVDTASLLFQTGFTGHAEMGLAGDNAFSVKVSADGSTWKTALHANAATGAAGFPNGATVNGPLSGTAVQSGPTDTTAGRLMRADYGYSPGNLLGTVSQSGGDPTGAVIEKGSNANGHYMRLADGTLICWTDTGPAVSCATADGSIYKSAATTWNMPSVFRTVNDYVVSCSPQTGTRWGQAYASNSGSAKFIHFAGTASGSSIATRLMAVGRWY